MANWRFLFVHNLGPKDTSDAAAKVPQPLDAILLHKDITWERLADVLGQINGLAAMKARENAGDFNGVDSDLLLAVQLETFSVTLPTMTPTFKQL